MPDPQPNFVSIANAEHYTWGRGCDGWHLLRTPELSMISERMPPGTSETMHYHERAQQVFYILTGVATFSVNGHTTEVFPHQGLHVPPLSLHRICNNHEEDLTFVLVSQPMAQGDRIDIIDYAPELSAHIKTLNYEWLEKYFRVEPGDEQSLSDPQGSIIDRGGFIYYAKLGDLIAGTASLLKRDEHTYELGKMAVTASARGHHIGNALMRHCIYEARNKGAQKLILYSNRSLAPAIHLYRKYGFVESEMESGHYERADIRMILDLGKT